MDVLAHGLWTYLVYAKMLPRESVPAVLFGVMPDVVSLGKPAIEMLFRPDVRRAMFTTDKHMSGFSRTAYRLYDLTHSIPIFSVFFFAVWLALGRPPWAMLAWLGHILVDIPTHSRAFFPTPFLFPFSRWTFPGYGWTKKWFLVANYASMALFAYYVLW